LKRKKKKNSERKIMLFIWYLYDICISNKIIKI